MAKMNWDRDRRERRFEHQDVTLRTGRRQLPGESGPTDGTPTRVETRQGGNSFLRALKDAAESHGTINVIVEDGRASLVVRGRADAESFFEADLVRGGADSRAETELASSPLHAAWTSLKFIPLKSWWPVRLELEALESAPQMLLWLRTQTPAGIRDEAGRVFLGVARSER